MSTPIYSNTNYRRNLILYWRQYYPNWEIPSGYHVHHMKPKCTFENKDDPRIHHPSNLIALHPDDHQLIHLMRGDKRASGGFLSIQGYIHSNETKRKMAESHIGLTHTEKSKRKMSAAHTGKKLSSTTRKKMSEYNTGKVLSLDTKEKISKNSAKFWLGKSLSKNHVQNLVNGKKGKKIYNNRIVNKYFTPGEEHRGFEIGKL